MRSNGQPLRLIRLGAAIATLGAAGGFPVHAHAQAQRELNISYVYPAGGQRGTTLRITVGGRRIPANAEAVFSGGGIEATLLAVHQPPRQDKMEELVNELRELTKRKEHSQFPRREREGEAPAPWSPDDERRLQELIEWTAMANRARDAPPFAERAEFEVRIAENVPLGKHDIRLAGAGGVSNPLTFEVSDLPEITEPPLTAANYMVRTGETRRFGPWRRWIELPVSEHVIKPPAVINGQIGPGERDQYRIEIKAGQCLVIAVTARELRPYLADAVPGWFDAVITLFDEEGRLIATADHWRFHPDPVLYYEAARAGIYTLEIRDCIYRGREDFVYRVAVGEFPFITDIFPLGGLAGAAVSVALRGWNLEQAARTISAMPPPGVYSLFDVLNHMHASPFLRISADTLPELIEQKRGGENKPQRINLPVMVNGVIEKPGERDVYEFEGKAGRRIVAEIYARRLGSPMDATLTLRRSNAVSPPLAFNDDHEDRGAGLVTHHADSRIEFELPADGFYRLDVTDVRGHGSPFHAYRLRVSEPRPDFEVRLVPSSVSPRRGTSAAVTAHVIRRDGFDGEVHIRLKNAPRGFSLADARVPADKDRAAIKFQAARDAPPGPTWIQFEAVATIGAEQVIRPAIPAEDLQQAFAWQFLVPTESFLVWMARPPPARAAQQPEASTDP